MAKGRREWFARHPGNPILTIDDWPYPANSVFNAGATVIDGETLLLVRVEDDFSGSWLEPLRRPLKAASRPATRLGPSSVSISSSRAWAALSLATWASADLALDSNNIRPASEVRALALYERTFSLAFCNLLESKAALRR